MTLKEIGNKIKAGKVIDTKEIQFLCRESQSQKGKPGKYDWDALDKKAAFGYPFSKDEIKWLYDRAEEADTDFLDLEVTPTIGVPRGFGGGSTRRSAPSTTTAPSLTRPSNAGPYNVQVNPWAASYGAPFMCNVCNKGIDGVNDHDPCIMNLDQTP